jgi:pilus assembly protein Flp/PilA
MYAVILALTNFTNKLSRREEGATAVEYGIMVALIAAVIIATVKTIGTQLLTAFNTVSAAL